MIKCDFSNRRISITMRNLIITRQKKFAGALIPYFCIIGVGKLNIDDSDKQYPIKNGETITIPIEEIASVIVVAAQTSTGLVFSDPVTISEGQEDVKADIVTKYDFFKGSSYHVYLK